MKLKKRIKRLIKKHNPADSTRRNVIASNRRDDELLNRLDKLEKRVRALESMPADKRPKHKRRKT